VDDIEFSDFTDDEVKFVKRIVKHYVHQTNVSIFKIKALKHIFSLTNLKTLFAIDDVRYYHEIILACKFNDIKTYAFQHGHFTKYHVGWLRSDLFKGEIDTPDFMLVWSPYWMNELMRLNSVFTSQSIIVGGVYENISRLTNGLTKKNQSRITVLVPYETSCPKSTVALYIKKMLECPHVEVIFKLRPDFSKEQQLAEYGIKEQFHEHFGVITDVRDVISEVDIVAGVYSTFLYDALAYTKRVLIFKTMSDYGDGMISNGLADRLDFEEDICFKLNKIKSMPEDIITKRMEKLYGEKDVLLLDTLYKVGVENKLM